MPWGPARAGRRADAAKYGQRTQNLLSRGLGELVERLRMAQWADPIHRVCLRGLRSTRLHDSIPPVDCHGNQVKPVIQVPRNFLVLWLQRATRGQKDGKSVQKSSVVGGAPGLFLLGCSCWWRRGRSGAGRWSDGRTLGAA